MKEARLSLRRCAVAALMTAALGAPVALADVGFTGSYTQNFQGMGPAGTATPADWFVGGQSGVDGLVGADGNGAISGTAVQVDDGSITAAAGTIGHYNYGLSGSASRSLGSIATTSRGHRALEVRLVNRTGFPIGSFEVRYDGKQWRVDAGGDQALVMKFSTDGVNFVTMGATFDFHSIQNNGTPGPLDGDTVRTNAIGGAYTPPAPIAVGQRFFLRWFDLNDAGVADHGLAIDNVTISNPQPAAGTLLTFQQGVGGYAGCVDTYIKQSAPSTAFGGASTLEWDGEDAGGMDFALLRFEGIFGNGAGQIAPTDQITSAAVVYEVTNTGNAATVNGVAVAWAVGDTYSTFGGDPGVQPDEYGSTVGSALGTPPGTHVIDVTSSLLAWQGDVTANRGWIFRPTGGTDGVVVRSSEDATLALRPRLTVLVNGGPPAARVLTVKHQPYLQLGDAPLFNTAPGVGTTDRIVIVWQTVEAGSGLPANDFFEVGWRATGTETYTPVGSVSTLQTGSGTRVNHFAEITGLPYDTSFEYRVVHKRVPASPVTVSTYTGAFRTRRAPDSSAPFVFAAHGDSAILSSPSEMAQFESVNSRITATGAEFVLLLGDNIYDTGTHDDFDARFDATVAPVNSAYIRNHVEYYAMGNHDATANSGQASLDNYAVPVPVLGITSPVAPPAGEVPEKNYSFDYGLVHVTVIDSTAWGGPGAGVSRQAAIVNWMAADLAASNQPWKIVVAHHPPKSNFGHSDTGEGMAAEVIPVLVQQGADLLLVGHSHNYQRSFPLTGHAGGDVTWILDQSGTYTKGAQVIQVIAGTGGRNIDCCAPTTATQWLARAFGSNNGGEVGPLLVEVSRDLLRVKYLSAASGAVKDEFVIVMPGPTIGVSPAALAPSTFIQDNPADGTLTLANTGTGTITYTLAVDAPWLSVAPNAGTSSGEPDAIVVSYPGAAALPVGIHTATITVTAPEATNSPRSVPVTLTVWTVRPDLDRDGDVDQEDFGQFQSCLSGAAVAQNAPGCAGARLDGDNDVDAADFDIFYNCARGANILPDRMCAGA